MSASTSCRSTVLLADLLEALAAADEATKRELREQLGIGTTAEPRLLNAREKGAQLGLHPETVVKMARAGRLAGARKIGNGWRFPAQDCAPSPVPATRQALDLGVARSPRRAAVVRRRSVEAIRGVAADRPRAAE